MTKQPLNPSAKGPNSADDCGSDPAVRRPDAATRTSPILLAFVREWMENSAQARAMARVRGTQVNPPITQIGLDNRTRAA
ncbi:MAG: hypothetical protein AABZ53_03075 [Planctomycetota bacterium]